MPQLVIAYEQNTHKGLTEASIKAYEQLRGKTFSSSERQAIVQGSWDEDDDWRFKRHFFDPVNNRGLTVMGQSFVSSRQWAQDTQAQGNYNCYGEWLCNGSHIGYSDKYFSSPTDYSWDRAVYEYAWGDKNRALSTLGHIMHLLQDATVPAHVRNDAHPNYAGVGDADPYEKYASRFGEGQVPVPQNPAAPSFAEIGSAFDSTARFTNGNFVSKDTLFEKFSSPNVNGLRIGGNFLYSPSGHKVARVEFDSAFFGGNRIKHVYIDDEKNSVVSDYWRMLSQKAIEADIGVMDLFFHEVEQEKKTGRLKAMNVSEAEKHAKATAQKGFKVVKALYGSSLSESDVAELLNEGQTGSAVLAVSSAALAPSPTPQTPPPKAAAPPTAKPQTPPAAAAKPRVPPVVKNAENRSVHPPSTAPAQTKAQPKTPPSETKAPAKESPAVPFSIPSAPGFSVSPGFGGGGSSAPSSATAAVAQNAPATSTPATSTPESTPESPAPESEPEPPAPSPQAQFAITSPADGFASATTSITFAGTADANATVAFEEDGTYGTTTADASGNWSRTFALSEAAHTLSFSAINASGNSSATTTRTVAVDLTSPSAPNPAIDACANSLSTLFCLSASTSVAVSWEPASGASRYELWKNDILAATTSATSSAASASDNATTTFAVVAYDSAGNAATSSSIAVRVMTRPLIINEIGWGGDLQSASNQWIELKNISPFALDLSRVALRVSGGTGLPLSEVLQPNTTSIDHLLILEAADMSSIVTTELVIPFGTLSSAGEQLSLVWQGGASATVIDETPAVSVCGGWCAGSVSAPLGSNVTGRSDVTTPLSMERASDSSDGVLAASWHSTDSYGLSGIWFWWGTPGRENSAGYPEAGWYCGSVPPVPAGPAPGPAYRPQSGNCTYLSRFITSGVQRIGGIYRGAVGSSTVVFVNFLGTNLLHGQTSDTIEGAIEGENFFAAIWEFRIEWEDAVFDAYFKTGTGAPPHNNYRTMPFTWGP